MADFENAWEKIQNEEEDEDVSKTFA
jgi:hypothetical protein